MKIYGLFLSNWSYIYLLFWLALFAFTTIIELLVQLEIYRSFSILFSNAL